MAVAVTSGTSAWRVPAIRRNVPTRDQVGRHDEAYSSLVRMPGLDPDHASLAEDSIEIVDDARDRQGGLRLGDDLRENRLQHGRLAKRDQVRRGADAQC